MIILILGVVGWVLFFNAKLDFLPLDITIAIDDICYKIFYNDLEKEDTSTSEYILLSTISESNLFESIDLLVPQDTYIPNKEEIQKNYSGIYSDSIVASFTNTDIIIQNYGISITEDMNIIIFRDQIVDVLKNNRPDISYDASHHIKKDGINIPTIEFSTEHNGRITYSYIAVLNVNEELVTITVNSMNYLFDSSRFFHQLITNMIVK